MREMQIGRHLLVIRQQLPGAAGSGPTDGCSGRRRTATTDPTYGCGEVEREEADSCADQQEAERRTAAAAARHDARGRDPGSSRDLSSEYAGASRAAVSEATVPAALDQHEVTGQLRSSVHARTAVAAGLGTAAAPVTTAASGTSGAAVAQALQTSGAAFAVASALKPCGEDSVLAASAVPHWTAAEAAVPATQRTEDITRQTRVAESAAAAAAAAGAPVAAEGATCLTGAAAATAATPAATAAAAGHVPFHTTVRGQSLTPPTTHSHTAAAGKSSVETAGVGMAGTALADVGLVVWQSGFVLAEYLLRTPPFGGWGDVSCVDLGTGGFHTPTTNHAGDKCAQETYEGAPTV